MMKGYNFCNNCGKQGHLFSQCKKPVTSIGIIVFRVVGKKIEYLLMCRRDSLGYIDFLRGKYPLYDPDYIQNLIDEMTVQEKTDLLDKDFTQLWSSLWGNYIGLQYRGEERGSEDKFKQMRRGIVVYNREGYDLKSLIEGSQTKWDSPEWGFPKGRRNYQESDQACAIREFEEETGFSAGSLDIVKNVVPLEEIFTGSNFKSYKHKYYLARADPSERPVADFQRSEVSDIRWLDLDGCLEHIRPYNLEKRKLIKDVDKILHRYRLIS